MDGLVVKINEMKDKRKDQAFRNDTQSCYFDAAILESPEFIAFNKTEKQEALFTCGWLCGDACPSETGKDRALDQFTENK